jgi:S1-C subfamily serine protease
MIIIARPTWKQIFKWCGFGALTLAAMTLIAALWFYQQIAPAAQLLEKGDQAFWRSHFSEAGQQYQAALQTAHLPSQRASAHEKICRLYGYQDQYSESLTACQGAVQASTSDAQKATALARLAQTYNQMGSFDPARRHAEEALRLDERNGAAVAAFAEALAGQTGNSGQDNLGQALAAAQLALNLPGEQAELSRTWGIVQLLNNNPDEAVVYFEKALALRPDFFAFYIDLGSAENARQNSDAALAAYEHALDLHPESIQALQGRGWVYWGRSEYDLAQLDFQQALKLDNTDSVSWAGLGWVYMDETNNDQARRAFNQALDHNSENDTALVGLENLALIEAAIALEIENELQAEEATVENEPVSPFTRAVGAAVQIYAFNETLDVHSVCSGTLISPNGYMITNAHCFGDTETHAPYNSSWLAGVGLVRDPRQPPERLYQARVLEANFDLDVALLEIFSDWNGSPIDRASLDLPFIPVGDSDTLDVGQEVWTVGFPGMGGDTLTITQGVISGFIEQNGLPWIKTDLMTGPGNSGAMVINSSGELVGVHTQSWSDQSQSSSRLAVERPINAARAMLEVVLAQTNDTSQQIAQATESAPANSGQAVNLDISRTAQVFAEDEDGNLYGGCSGVMISPQGFLLAAADCLEQTHQRAGDRWVLRVGGPPKVNYSTSQLYEVIIVRVEPAENVALLQIISEW